MSETNRPVRGAHRALNRLVLVVAGAILAAMSSAGAGARSMSTPASTSPPTISGNAVVGETLTATTGSWTGTPPLAYAYAWQLCDAVGASCAPVAGADGPTYAVAEGDLGSTLRIEVTATNGQGTASAVSPPTPAITLPVAPVNVTEPVISGSTVEGARLTTTSGTWLATGTVAYAYQWVRCDADGGLPDGSSCPTISGATSAGYTVTTDDVGSRLRVQVTASNAVGPTSVASNPTAIVTRSTTVGLPHNTAEPSITGTPTQGRTLVASSGTWTGATPIAYAYQWVRCGKDGGLLDSSNCSLISGATTSSYIPSGADVGQRLRIRVSASNGAGTATVASNATLAVAAVTTAAAQAPSNRVPPAISGAATVGGTLFGSVGAWAGTAPLTYTYEWLRCAADGSSCMSVSSAAGTVYAPTADDVGQRLRLRVTAQNTSGSATATSLASGQVQSGQTQGGTAMPFEPPLPVGAVRLPSGQISIPVTAVLPPERLLVRRVAYSPRPVRSRTRPVVLRVWVVDTRGYVVRDAIVSVGSTRAVMPAAAEVTTSRDGRARIRLLPRASFPLRDGRRVDVVVRVRRQGDELVGGVSARRLVRIATSG